MKHVALVAALGRLTEKDRPLFLLDTHAGRGRYDLAATGGEAAGGIARVLAAGLDDTHPALARYLAMVRGMNEGDRLASYPGSPMIEAAFMRAGDRAAFCELLAGEADALRRLFRGDARVGVHCRDGFEALAALLPPPEKRGLALIDPPYEEQERDLERVAEALVAAAARWPQGALMADTPLTLAETASVFGEMLTFRALLARERGEVTAEAPPSDGHTGEVDLAVQIGGSSERIFLFYARVRPNHRTRENASGLAGEGENIATAVVPRQRFIKLARTGKLEDAKTLVAGLWLAGQMRSAS